MAGRQEITIARQKEYMAGLKDDIESDKKEKEEACRIRCWLWEPLDIFGYMCVLIVSAGTIESVSLTSLSLEFILTPVCVVMDLTL